MSAPAISPIATVQPTESAFGLYSHMRSNRVRSTLLLAGLFVLAWAATVGGVLVWSGFAGSSNQSLASALPSIVSALPFVTVGTLIWVFIGFRFNVAMIAAVSGAKPVTRADDPRLYRLLENLCISRGLPTPKLFIIEDDALNAFASGVNDDQFSVTVTRGLLATLTDPEIEAVLAHELTHIRNGDVRMMVIALVIAGVVSFAGEIVFRVLVNGGARGRRSDDSKGNAALIGIGIAIIVVAGLLSVVLRLSLSRSREYLADAGAVELTKNPDAMISALLKIAGRADIAGAPSSVMDMAFENDPDDWSDLFSTHPSVAKRVQALVDTAGGRMPPRPPPMARRPDLYDLTHRGEIERGRT